MIHLLGLNLIYHEYEEIYDGETYRPVARLGEASGEGADAVGHVRPSPPGIKMHEDI